MFLNTPGNTQRGFTRYVAGKLCDHGATTLPHCEQARKRAREEPELNCTVNATAHFRPLAQVFGGEEPELYVNSADAAVVQHGSVQLGNKSYIYVASVEFQAANPDGPKLGKMEAADYDFSKLPPMPQQAQAEGPAKRARGADGADGPGQGTDALSQVRMYTMWPDQEAVDGVFARCAEQGCGTVTMPPSVVPWGMYWGELTDPWGVQWMVTCELPKPTQDQAAPGAEISSK